MNLAFTGLLTLLTLAAPADFDETFTGKTLRFDYYHTGTRTEEVVSLDEVRLEDDWPGGRHELVDGNPIGLYLFEVVDPDTEAVVYSQSFASVFGEWQTTAEAGKGIHRTFHESQRFPETKKPCRLVLKKRNQKGALETIFTSDVDPKSRFVNRSPVVPRGKVWQLLKSGPPSEKVDLLVMGDGYTESELPKFHADVGHLVGILFQTEPFKSHRSDFNVWVIDVASPSSGITQPRKGSWINTPLGLSFNSFDLPRYVLTEKNKALRAIAASAPYDTLALLANTERYGGGGIYNLWTTCAAGNARAPYVFVHEMGHSFGGLADEYYTSAVAYEDLGSLDVEPPEPNVTALLDRENLKWKDLVEAGTPLPTPWKKEDFDKISGESQKEREKLLSEGAGEESIEAHASQSKTETEAVLETNPWIGKVGAFEGAAYRAKGLYRPEVDCIMFSGVRKEFCRVCARAIEKAIERNAK